MNREFSSGGVVFKKKEGKTLWLVTKSAPSDLYPKGYWRLPKGWLDDENDGVKPGPLAKGVKRAKEKQLAKAALREVEEEGGVRAKIVKKIGTLKYFRGKNSLKFVTFYLMQWTENLPAGPGAETEKVEWLPFSEAKKKLKYVGEKEFLEKAKKLLR